jgi:hypothetical protein
VNSQVAGTILLVFTAFAKASNLSSKTFTIQTFGSIVQKGKLAASAV